MTIYTLMIYFEYYFFLYLVLEEENEDIFSSVSISSAKKSSFKPFKHVNLNAQKPIAEPNLIRSKVVSISDQSSIKDVDGKKNTKTTAVVSLNDCLACSGCVTSAESVLITSQSETELDRILQNHCRNFISHKKTQNNPKSFYDDNIELKSTNEEKNKNKPLDYIFIILSNPSIASLASSLNITKRELITLIENIFQFKLQKNFDIVLQEQHKKSFPSSDIFALDVNVEKSDIDQKLLKQISFLPLIKVIHANIGKHIWLDHVQNEFIEKYLRSQLFQGEIDSDGKILESKNVNDIKSIDLKKEANELPLLSSSCPGWVCFAEKTAHQAVDYLSSVKSPQQILGSLLSTVTLELEEHRHRIGHNISSRSLLDHEYDPSEEKDLDQLKENIDFEILGDRQKEIHNSKLSGNNVLTVSIMPCFDKKLEASRKEFQIDEKKDVDLVLTSAEILSIIEDYEQSVMKNQSHSLPSMRCDSSSKSFIESIFNLDVSEFPSTKSSNTDVVEVSNNSVKNIDISIGMTKETKLQTSNTIISEPKKKDIDHGSGGFVEHLFVYTAKRVFNLDVTLPLDFKEGRNPDFMEVELKHPQTNQILLRAAKAYGFRNIQAVIQRMKRNKCQYHLVEVMACPSGCLNGGGQIKQIREKFSSTSSYVDHLLDTLYNESPNTKNISQLSTNYLPSNYPSSSTLGNLKENTDTDLLGHILERLANYLQLQTSNTEESITSLENSQRNKQRQITQMVETWRQKIIYTTYNKVPKMEITDPLRVKW